MTIIAIDPGTTQSGFVAMNADGDILNCGVAENEELIDYLGNDAPGHILAIEMIQSFGMPVGAEVFATCVYIGRLIERWQGEYRLVFRKDIKLHLCGSPRAKDGNIRQALIDLYGGKEAAIGKKATPGPLYKVKSHAWAALAVADFCRRASV
jgi:hypothetical protein